MLSENFREQLEKGSPSYTVYSHNESSRILTEDEVEIFKNAFDKKNKHFNSGSISAVFTLEDQMPQNFAYATTSQTLLYQRPIRDSSSPCSLSDEEALLIAAESEQTTQAFFKNSRSTKLKSLMDYFRYYLTDADKTILAQQQSPIGSSKLPQESKPTLEVKKDREHPAFASAP